MAQPPVPPPSYSSATDYKNSKFLKTFNTRTSKKNYVTYYFILKQFIVSWMQFPNILIQNIGNSWVIPCNLLLLESSTLRTLLRAPPRIRAPVRKKPDCTNKSTPSPE